MPRKIWTPDLYEQINEASGLLLITDGLRGELSISCERRARPDRQADKITAGDAVDIARLASLRMWDAYSALDNLSARPA